MNYFACVMGLWSKLKTGSLPVVLAIIQSLKAAYVKKIPVHSLQFKSLSFQFFASY